MVGATAYLSYLVSDHSGLSGIVSLFCCSVTMSHYALHSLTRSQRAATLSSFETLSYLAEGSIFVYVGLDALDPEKWAVRAPISCSWPPASCAGWQAVLPITWQPFWAQWLPARCIT